MATDNLNKTKVTVKSAARFSVGTLMIMNIVAVVSLRGLPAEAVYGLSLIQVSWPTRLSVISYAV